MNKKIITAILLLCFIIPNTLTSMDKKKNKIVVIDAGHGGKDTGAIGNKSKEKDLVLILTKLVGKYLTENMDNVDVVYTRSDDTFVPLRERAKIANDKNANLFVSIHINANKSTKPYGTETYAIGPHKNSGNLEVAKKENSVIVFEEDYSSHYEGFDPNLAESYIMFSMMQNIHINQSLSVASYVESEFKNRAKLNSRGVKQAGFLVLWLTSMPSVLIECGFISNEKEEAYLNSKQGQEYIASAIYRAIKKYIDELTTAEAALATPTFIDNNADIALDSAKSITTQITYRVQTTSSSIPIDKNNSLYNNYKDIYEFKENDRYKYAIGNFESYEQAKEYQKTLKETFPDAFIVSFKGDEKISISEALK